MALNPDILTTDVDALSPIDETLMGGVRENLIRLDDSIFGPEASASPIIQFKLNGPLDMLPNGKAKRVDAAFISAEQSLGAAKLYLDRPGTGGTLEVDLRKLTTPQIPIASISHQYQAATQSIARAGSAYSTQSITRTTTQIATQSITEFKPALNVLSIIGLGNNLWQYNLSAAPDADWVVGDTVTFASCTTAANNGSFVIVGVNYYGSSSVVVTNASGVAQTSAAGTCTLRAYRYNFTNPVSTQIVAGESALFASHTTAANNGTLAIYAVNAGGNNIVVKNPTGATQAGVAGVVDVLRFSYNFSIPAPAADYVVGDTLNAASHSSAGNNGNFRITAVNSGGNNLQVYNTSGVTQGGVAGSVNSNQWTYALPTDPASQVSVGDELYLSGHSNAANDGQFPVRQVKRAATNNVTIHNSSGVAQAGVAGTVTHTRKLVNFAADQSAAFAVGSLIELQGTPSTSYASENTWELGHVVLEINRGGGASYNVVIKVDGAAPAQSSQAGWVSVESRSLFTTTPKIEVSPNASRTLGQSEAMVQTTAGVFVSPLSLGAGTKLALYILQTPTGAESLALQVR